ILGCSNSSPLRLKLISTVICMPGRDCSGGGGTQHASSAASRSVSVLMGVCGFSAAALAESAAITSASPAIWKRDLNIGQTYRWQTFSIEKSIEQYPREDNERPTGRKIVSLPPD